MKMAMSVLMVFCALSLYGQHGGFLVNVGTAGSVGGQWLFPLNKKGVVGTLGFDYQFNGQKGTVVSERKSNYGTTKERDGDFFWLVTFGAGYGFGRFVVAPELGLGSRVYYSNYTDNRFNGGGYSLIRYKELQGNAGVTGVFRISQGLGFALGLHTSKRLCFGLGWMF